MSQGTPTTGMTGRTLAGAGKRQLRFSSDDN
jgi:hypothetical protein